MNILLHTIALEPARWISQRVSQKLSDLIPKIAHTRFRDLEIFEPHLAAEDEALIASLLKSNGLAPVILSSYLQVAPKLTTGEKFLAENSELVARVRRFQFRKVRLFPGGGISPGDKAATDVVAHRLSQVAAELPEVQILIETHDGSIADEPEEMVALVQQINLPNVSLLWQPTVFQTEPALRQLAVQKHYVRHVHLQNRNPDGSYTTLKNGVVPWDKILPQFQDTEATIEFVPSAICSVDEFDLETSLAEAVTEAGYAESISA